MKHWLITYQVSRNDGDTWRTYNDAVNYSPGTWLITQTKALKRLGFTNVTFLNAVEITQEEYTELIKVLDI